MCGGGGGHVCVCVVQSLYICMDVDNHELCMYYIEGTYLCRTLDTWMTVYLGGT